MSESEILEFEVSSNNFDTVVLENSNKLPVLVEFMGVWSGPCIQMSEQISSLAKEFSGQFIFAKVDIDEQAELKEKYGITNIPCLKVFKDGDIKQTEEGQLSREEVAAVLKEYGVFSEADELRLQAREQHMQGNTSQAIQLLVKAMKQDPSNVKVALDMGQIFIDLNEIEQAKGLYNQLPNSAKTSDLGKQLLGQLTALTQASKTVGITALHEQLLQSPDSCDIRFDLAVCLVADKDYVAAVDYLFEILKIDSKYKQGAANEMIVNAANMLTSSEPDLASSFRRRLGNID